MPTAAVGGKLMTSGPFNWSKGTTNSGGTCSGASIVKVTIINSSKFWSHPVADKRRTPVE
jgi:hypothetical protein